ncbi:MAG: two-component sensor histidine kinase [Thermoleophilia bacterium]|nr:two-component sensor histidine kinase [Thermoleophilia bacterium]
MQTAIEIIARLGIPLLVAMAVATILVWRRTRCDTARLLAFAISVFTVGTLLGYLPWAVGDNLLAAFISKFRFLMTLSFPYLLLRFANAFQPVPRWLIHAATAGLVAISVYVVFLPANFGSPTIDTDAPAVKYALNAVIFWLLIVMPIAAICLFRAGRGQPGVARRRMRMLGTATLIMFTAYLSAFLSPDYAATYVRLYSYITVDVAAVAFYIGFAPSASLRTRWRREEERELRAATAALMSATSRNEVLEGFLPKVVRLVGASSAALVRDDGTVASVEGIPHEAAAAMVLAASGDTGAEVEIERSGIPYSLTKVPFGTECIALLTTPVTPLLGEEELELLQWLGVIVELALERCERMEEERAVTDRLREVDRLKSEFVQIVAHDLRSPMTAIGGMAATMRAHWTEFDEQKKLEFLGHIDTSTHRMAELVVDVLDVARIESGELSFEMTPFDLGDLVRAAVDEFRASDGDRPIDLSSPGPLPDILGDPLRNRQVIDNLLSNAWKYSPEHEPIRVAIAHNDGELVVSVRDYGAGIDVPDQQRIFEKFGRATDGSGPNGHGTGALHLQGDRRGPGRAHLGRQHAR